MVLQEMREIYRSFAEFVLASYKRPVNRRAVMRIVFFTHYYPPEVNAPASRTSEHCRVWAELGHEVTVVTGAPNHPHGQIYPGYRNRLWSRERVDGVDVVRLWTYVAPNQGFGRRTLNYVSFLVSAVFALPLLPRADVYVSTSPQFFCGLIGVFAKALRRKPWALEIRDLWPESIVAVGAMRKGLATRALEGLEAFAYRQADAIVSVTRSFTPHIGERCGNPSKIAVFVNGVDAVRFEPPADREAAKAQFGLSGKIVAAYVGTHGMAHGLETMLDAAETLANELDIVFLLVGDGSERQRLEAERDRRGLKNVVMLGQRPKSDMPAIWGATDVSLILLKRSDTFKKVLPSKMAEAMAMQCPIVLGVEGEAAAVLEDSRAGVAIEPENAAQLADAVLKFARDPERRRAMGEAGRAFALKRLDRSAIARDYLAMLQSTAGK